MEERDRLSTSDLARQDELELHRQPEEQVAETEVAPQDAGRDESRLEVSTTAGSEAFAAVSRRATSKPSVSGSCTSRSTTCGWSWPAASTAEAPSWASPTTWKPSDSRS